MKIIRVKNCFRCPYRVILNSRWQCKDMEHRTIPDVLAIPTWCPLEDEASK